MKAALWATGIVILMAVVVPEGSGSSAMVGGRLPQPQSVGEAQPGGGGAVVDGLQLLLDSSKAAFGADEPVDVTLHLKNLGGQPRQPLWADTPSISFQ